MNQGLRRYRKASCRICVPVSLPEALQSQVRELVSVISEAPRKGHATALMHKVCDEADDAWLTLMLLVKPFDQGMTEEQLMHFYERFDFFVAGHDPTIMVRAPHKPRRLH